MISITKVLWHLTLQSDLLSKIIVYFLIIMTFITIALFIYSYLILKNKKNYGDEILKDYYKNEKFIIKNNSILNLMENIIKNKKYNKEDQLEIFSHLINTYFSKEKNINMFFLCAAASSPLFGLLGTVWGIIHAFMGISSGGDLTAVAPGIAEALITTLAGLFVAIPALIFYHFLNNYIKNIIYKYDLISWYFVNSNNQLEKESN